MSGHTTTPEQFVRAALRTACAATVNSAVQHRFGVSAAAATKLINQVSRAEEKRNFGRQGNGSLAPTHKGSTRRSPRRLFSADQEVGDLEEQP